MILCQHTFWRLRWGTINLVIQNRSNLLPRIDGRHTDLDEGNISTSIEELSVEERQEYLAIREHFKAQFLK